MGRPAKGSVQRRGNLFVARISLPDGRRPWIELPADIQTEDAARAMAAELSIAARKRAVQQQTKPVGETLAAYVLRWLAPRYARKMTSARVSASYLRIHVLPQLGSKPIDTITTDDLEDVVSALDAKVRDDELSWKAATNIWGNVTKLFDDAHRAKDRALRVIDHNPCTGIRGPDRGEQKSKVYLYPSEFDALVRCEGVPLYRRQLYALAIYTYLRPSELEALEWDDVDLQHGTIHAHQTVDGEYGGTKELKTKSARVLPIEPALLPLMHSLHAQRTGPRVIEHMPPDSKLATTLRADLERAGITRAALLTETSTRRHLRFYDLRATGITWCAVRGDDPIKLQRRAGHSSLSTTQVYIREAENLASSFGTVFPALNSTIESSRYRPEVPAPNAQGVDSIAEPASGGGRIRKYGARRNALPSARNVSGERDDHHESQLNTKALDDSWTIRQRHAEAATFATLERWQLAWIDRQAN